MPVISKKYVTVVYQSNTINTDGPLLNTAWWDSLEVLVLSGGADLGGVSLSQFVQASGVLELELSFSAEELLQVLQQLQTGLRLLLQTTELLNQLVADLCVSKRRGRGGQGLHTGPHFTLPNK